MIADLKPYPAMKDSGIEWLGEVPAHWEMPRMKAVLRERSRKGFPNEPLLAATQTRGVVRKDQYENRTVVALKDLHLLKLVNVGDFVISLRSFQGGIEYARERGIISPAYSILYAKDVGNHGFLARLFKSKPYIENLGLFVTGIRQGQNVDYVRLSRSRLPLPPPDGQLAIVRYLEYVDRRVRRLVGAKRKLIALLTEQKQAIIHRAVTRGLDPDVPLKDSGVEWLGKVPEHWELRRFKQVARIQGGYAFPAELFGSVGTPVVRMNNLRRGILDLGDVVRIGEDQCKAAFGLNDGDILYGLSGSIGATGSLGNYAVIRSCDLPAQLNQRVARFAPITKCITQMFLAESLQTGAFYEQVLSNTTGTAQFNVSTNDIGNVYLALPPVSKQEQISEHLFTVNLDIDTAITRASREIELLNEYRTRLIADVVTGKLDVREAAAELPEEDPLDGEGGLKDGLGSDTVDPGNLDAIPEEVEA